MKTLNAAILPKSLILLLAGFSAVAGVAPTWPTAEAGQAEGAALRAAASRGDLDGVQAQIEQGVPVDAANEYGATPLILASMNGHAEVVRALLDAGADPERADTFYRRAPIEWASAGGHDQVASILFVAGAGDFRALFLEAVEAGEVDQVAALLRIQVPAEEVLTEALQAALASRNQGLAELLVGYGAVPPEPTVVSIDPDRLRLFEGRYVDDVGYELVIVADMQTRSLLVRPPGMRNPLRFVPVGDATFIAEQTPGINLRFVVRGGRVASLSFAQPGVTRRMTRQ